MNNKIEEKAIESLNKFEENNFQLDVEGSGGYRIGYIAGYKEAIRLVKIEIENNLHRENATWNPSATYCRALTELDELITKQLLDE